MSIDAFIDSILGSKGIQGGGNLIQDGAYTLALRKLYVEKSGKKSATYLKAEMYVVSSAPIGTIPAELLRPNETPNPLPNPDGTDVFKPFDIASAPGANDAKAFLCALLGVQPATVESDWLKGQIMSGIGNDQPLKGRLVTCTTFRTITKSGANKDKPFVGHNWRTIAVTPEQIAAIRAELDAGRKV